MCVFPMAQCCSRVKKNNALIKDIGCVVSGSERDVADEMNRSRGEAGRAKNELKPNGIIQFKGWLSVEVDKRVICMVFLECKY